MNFVLQVYSVLPLLCVVFGGYFLIQSQGPSGQSYDYFIVGNRSHIIDVHRKYLVRLNFQAAYLNKFK